MNLTPLASFAFACGITTSVASAAVWIWMLRTFPNPLSRVRLDYDVLRGITVVLSICTAGSVSLVFSSIYEAMGNGFITSAAIATLVVEMAIFVVVFVAINSRWPNKTSEGG